MERAFLPPSLMVTSIIGFIIAAAYTVIPITDDDGDILHRNRFDSWFEPFYEENGRDYDGLGTSLGFAMCLTFVIMFIASMISMTPSDKELGVS